MLIHVERKAGISKKQSNMIRMTTILRFKNGVW